MEHTANGQPAEFFVVLADQADISQAADFQTKAEKGRYVFDTLLEQGSDHSGTSFAMVTRTQHRTSILLYC